MLEELRRRFRAAVERVRELRAAASGGEAVTDEQRSAINAAVAEAEALATQLREAEAQEERVAELERLERAANRVGQAPAPHTDPGNTGNGRHQYSLVRAIQGQLNAILGTGEGLNGLELETHQHLASARSKPPVGVLVPWDAELSYRGSILGPQRRSGEQLSTITGSGAVPEIRKPTMIDVLRARLVLTSLGATLFTDMSQPFSIPKTTVTVTAGHVTTEGTNVAESNPTIDDINFAYRSLEATTKLTRQFINASVVSAEIYIVDQLTKAVATTLEDSALNGTGTNGAAKGLFKYTGADGINVKVLGANGAAPSWLDVLAMVGGVDNANAPNARRAFLINPLTAAYFQGKPKVDNQAVFILDSAAGKIAGYDYASTSLVKSNLTKGTGTGLSAMAFGAWEELYLALFTGADLYIDPFSTQPHVRVTVAQDYDVNFAHLESFSICLDAKTS